MDTAKMNIKEENQFRRAILGGIFLVLVAFWATEVLLLLIPWLAGMPYEYYLPDGGIRAISILSIILSRTILLWLYTNWASRQNIFHIKFNPNITLIIVTIALSLTIAIVFYIFGAKGGIVYSWFRFSELYGHTLGATNTILQYLYYACEGMAMVWIVNAFQTAGEIRSKRSRVPWGIVGLCLFWAFPHLATKGLHIIVLLWALSFAVIFGALYLKCKKNFWPPFLFWMVYCIAFCY